uniref:PHD-type domain-containing protein n=1 Tax=Stegastes partitus TaxID=144197 RepID=A0A3B4Z8N1_9TELE
MCPESRCPVRRSGRQPKRTDKLEEFLLTTKRGARKSAPPSLESGDPPSQTPTDAETASEASFDGNADSKVGEERAESPERRTRSGVRKQAQRKSGGGRQTRGCGGATVKDEGSSENEEDGTDAVRKDQSQDNDVETKEDKSDPTSEDIVSINAAQMQLEQDSEKTEVDEEKNEHGDKNDQKRVASKNTTAVKAPKDTKPKAIQSAGKIGKPHTQDDDDENDSCTSSSSSSSSSSSVESDDGGYDPNALYCICRQKHNKRFMICCDRCEEWFHGDCVGITEARGRLMERNGEDYICPNCTAKKNQVVSGADSSLSAAVAGTPSFTTTGTEEKGVEDLGIKGRIEKATHPTGKKKIKIFQPVADQKDDSSLPKCIGPGCDNNAQPDSVYCGNDCILRHAAAAMKSITDVKEPKQKDKDKSKAQKNKSTPKEEDSDSEEDSSDADEDDEDEHAEEHPPPPATASWSSDHNYIAVTPEKTTPISPTVLNKKCMYLFEGLGLLRDAREPWMVSCWIRRLLP